LETAKARVEAAQSEAKVMSECRNLVEMARHNLQLELSSIRPELAPSLKTDESHIGKEELNILLHRLLENQNPLEGTSQSTGLFHFPQRCIG